MIHHGKAISIIKFLTISSFQLILMPQYEKAFLANNTFFKLNFP